MQDARSGLRRNDERVIIHFDYDCFYAAVFEKRNPALKSLPFAVQQKQIIVTCNYEARRRGLYKLQLVREARKKCPEVIIALGEDLTNFRDSSKENYDFLRSYSWSNKVERLGFDEVFMDVTDLVDYNAEFLNHCHLSSSFFHLDRRDPTKGFSYDASAFSGHTYPEDQIGGVAPKNAASDDSDDLSLRLKLGSHLAQYLRHELDNQKGYTSTVGISTNKLLSKLIGNVHKPRGQTTLVPPYNPNIHSQSNVVDFIDAHDVGKIPGVGFKTAQKIRAYVLGRSAAFGSGLVYGGSRENVIVKDVRLFDGIGPKLLQKVLEGPGVPKDLPEKVWGLLNGVDDAEVGKAREVPQQISIEDSYIRLDELSAVVRELKMLSTSLIRRMRLDLTTLDDDTEEPRGMADQEEEPDLASSDPAASRRWLAYPKTIRLSTRPRPPLSPDGSRQRTFARISKSGSLPSFVFSLAANIEHLSQRLVDEVIMPLFRNLHPEPSGWNLSLVNICATNMTIAAGNGKDGVGRDIAQMFSRQEDVLKEWRVGDDNLPKQETEVKEEPTTDMRHKKTITQASDDRMLVDEQGSEDALGLSQDTLRDDELSASHTGDGEMCEACGAIMPAFAMTAHEMFHNLPD